MMSPQEVWAENDLLRERLRAVQAELAQERESRLNLQAEVLWLKRLLSKEMRDGDWPAVSGDSTPSRESDSSKTAL